MEWAARAIGGFYVLGGLMLLHQTWLSWRLQRALSGLVSTSLTDHLAEGVIALGGLLVLASGLALVALSAWAVAAFLAGWSLQALYLLWGGRGSRFLAPLRLEGRRRSVHAFAGYTAATGLVLVLPLTGILA